LIELKLALGRSHYTSAARISALARAGARSLLSAPVIAHGEIVGVFTAVSAQRTYDQRDLEFWANITSRAAMAVENAWLHADLQRAHAEIAAQLSALHEAHHKIRTLTGLLPVCAWCGRIRDDRQGGRWRRFDEFVMDHTAAEVSHGICPDCASLHRGALPDTAGLA
jgi:hypothetical protein